MTKHAGNINSLPKWAQEYIRRLESARREADRRYNELVDKMALLNSPLYVPGMAAAREKPSKPGRRVVRVTVTVGEDS